MAEQKSYLISGGAGFLGINLVRYLLDRHHKVTTLDIAPFDYPEKPLITEIIGDIRDRAAVDKAMQGIDIVIHTAAALPLYSEADIMSTDLDGTRNMIDSAFKAGVERFVHVSSTAVYGIPDHHPLLETDKLDGVGPYGKAKIAAEEVCFEYRKKRNVCAGHPSEVVHRAGTLGRVRAVLRLGEGWARLSDVGERQ